MNTYQVNYKIGKKGYVYPKGVVGTVWVNIHYNETENMFVAETESKLVADGTAVVEVTKADADALIKNIAVIAPKLVGDPIVLRALK